MKILFYGRLADAVGPEVDIDAPAGWSIAQVRDLLSVAHPESASTLSGRRALACVGGSFVPDDYVIGERDCIEFLPPVSGG